MERASDGVVTTCVEDSTAPMTGPRFAVDDLPWWTPIGDFCLREAVMRDPTLAAHYALLSHIATRGRDVPEVPERKMPERIAAARAPALGDAFAG